MSKEKPNKATPSTPARIASKTSAVNTVNRGPDEHTVTVSLDENGNVVVAPPELEATPNQWVRFEWNRAEYDLIIICMMEEANQTRRRAAAFSNGYVHFNPAPLMIKRVSTEGKYTYSAFLLDRYGILHDSDPSIIIRPRLDTDEPASTPAS